MHQKAAVPSPKNHRLKYVRPAAASLKKVEPSAMFATAMYSLHAPAARGWLRRQRRKNPHARPEDLIAILNGQLKGVLMASGAGVTAGLAAPGIAKFAGLTLLGGQAIAVIQATAFYVTARALIHQIEDPVRLRALMLAALSQQEQWPDAGGSLRAMAPALLASTATIKGNASKFAALKLTALPVIRKAPAKLLRGMPVAASGFFGAHHSGKKTVEIVDRADLLFGPPPASWGS